MEFIKPGTHFDFVGKMKIAVGISAVLIIVSILTVVLHGGLNFGIDFAGGTVIQIKFSKAAPACSSQPTYIFQTTHKMHRQSCSFADTPKTEKPATHTKPQSSTWSMTATSSSARIPPDKANDRSSKTHRWRRKPESCTHQSGNITCCQSRCCLSASIMLPGAFGTWSGHLTFWNKDPKSTQSKSASRAIQAAAI